MLVAWLAIEFSNELTAPIPIILISAEISKTEKAAARLTNLEPGDFQLGLALVFFSASVGGRSLRISWVGKLRVGFAYYPPLLRNQHGLLRRWLFSGNLFYQEDLHRE